jgi:hypothetical protein
MYVCMYGNGNGNVCVCTIAACISQLMYNCMYVMANAYIMYMCQMTCVHVCGILIHLDT